ncbi:MAG: hypothetical protein JO303_14725 [Caulobacteraceae bacterium]|nr:hypothetical protein [Caulobacteraceae bacterium]
MFLTEALTPVEALIELIKGPRTRPEQTVRFAKLRHDKHLCPRFRDHVDVVLEAYQAYRTDVHDIQGIRDDGVDVLFRYTDDDGNVHKAGLQIKSEDEFVRWEKGTYDLPNKLKAQFASALSNIRVEDYFVVLCVDAVRHQKRLRLLCSELKNFKEMTIIEPTDALGFYQTSALDLLIRTTRLLCRRDRILKAATDELDAEYPDVAFFLVTLVCQAFDVGLEVTQARLAEIWEAWVEFVGGDADRLGHRLGDILGALLNPGVLSEGGSDFAIAVDRLPTAVCALYFDQKVRALQPDANLRDYLARLTGLADRQADEDDELDDD